MVGGVEDGIESLAVSGTGEALGLRKGLLFGALPEVADLLPVVPQGRQQDGGVEAFDRVDRLHVNVNAQGNREQRPGRGELELGG